MPGAWRYPNPRDGGFVLVSVLWILAILTVLALGFARRSMLERRMAWYALDHQQAQHMARAAAERGLFELRNMRLVSAFDQQPGYVGLDQRWHSGIDLVSEGYFQDVSGPEFQFDVCTARIEDVDRFVSLNYAPESLLRSVKPLGANTISDILERRSPSTRGYQRTLFQATDELREMQSFTDEQWYGDGDQPGLKDIFSAYGDPGGGRINVNTAPAAVLELLPDIDGEVVTAIMKYRNGPDGIPYTRDDQAFENLALIGQHTDVSAEKLRPINAYCKTTSRFFTITGHASRRRGKVNAYCTITVDLQGNVPVIVAWRDDTLGA